MPRLAVPTLFLMLAMVLAAPVARADSATAWQAHDDMLKTRLVAASSALTDKDGALFGWDADMADGWKTYWRSPGAAGLPVRIHIDGQPVDILFPLPHRFDLAGIDTLGYGHQLLLPFRLPVGTRAGSLVTVDFMVCKDICVPLQASYKLPETPAASADDARFTRWLAQVPDRTGGGGAGLRVDDVKVTGLVGHQRLVVDVSADVPLSDADLMAEGDDMVRYGLPAAKLMADGLKARFVIMAMMGSKPYALGGHAVRLTFTDGHGHAIDRTVTIPAPAASDK